MSEFGTPVDDRPVLRHAPDQKSYHHADGRQLDRMPSSRLKPVIVPRARRDGSSPAFDGSKAGVVVVDPAYSDGSVVDMSTLTARDMYRALSGSKFPHQVFSKLGVSTKEAGVGREVQPVKRNERDNPHIPSSGYITPQSGADGSQTEYSDEDEDTEPLVQHSPSVFHKEKKVLQPVPPLTGVVQPVQVPQSVVPQMVQPVLQQHAPQHTMQQAPNMQQPYQQPQQQSYPMQPLYPQQPPPYWLPQQPVPPVTTDPMILQAIQGLTSGLEALNRKIDGREQEPKPEKQVRRRVKPQVRSTQVGAPVRTTDEAENEIGEEDDELKELPPVRGSAVDKSKLRKGKRRRDEEEEEEEEEEEDTASIRPGTRRRTQHVSDMKDKPKDGMIIGFETLRLPFVTGPVPMKARRKVVFDLGELGKQSALFHDVIESDDNIVLVWDSRYEDGNQYEPPVLGPTRPFNVTVQSRNKEAKTYVVCSLGVQVKLGVFEQTVLLKHASQPGEEEFPDSDE